MHFVLVWDQDYLECTDCFHSTVLTVQERIWRHLRPVEWSFFDHLPTEIHIIALYPVVKSLRTTPSPNVMHLKCSDSNRAPHGKGKPHVNNSRALSAPCQVVCHVNMYCLEPIIRQCNLLCTEPWLDYFSAGGQSKIHNTETHMEVIWRWIPSGVNSSPHAGARPLSFGFKADVVKLNVQ